MWILNSCVKFFRLRYYCATIVLIQHLSFLFLRRTKLDMLPQLWNVLKGKMSLVGLCAGLFNQAELTAARDCYGVFTVPPGITGLSQVNEINISTPDLLAESDAKMITEMSLANYFKYIFQTVSRKGSGDRVKN